MLVRSQIARGGKKPVLVVIASNLNPEEGLGAGPQRFSLQSKFQDSHSCYTENFVSTNKQKGVYGKVVSEGKLKQVSVATTPVLFETMSVCSSPAGQHLAPPHQQLVFSQLPAYRQRRPAWTGA